MTYETYPVILTVAAFIQDKNGRILIVKKSPFEKIDAGLWTVPGGKVEPSEHITTALKREIKEETQLTIAHFTWVGEDVFKHEKWYFHGEHFLCKVEKTEPIVLEKNLLDFTWITKKQISSYIFHPNIKNRLIQLL